MGTNDHAEQQRKRILLSARECFIADGFHAASIGDIAAKAGVSQGLLYRYFENKRAIILAIIRMQLDDNRDGLNQVQVSTDFIDELLGAYAMWGEGAPGAWHVGLSCEMNALGMRDPQVAGVLHESEMESRRIMIDWLRQRDAQRGKRSSARETHLRALLMQCLVDGLSIRAARDPGLDPKLLRSLLERVLPLVLAD